MAELKTKENEESVSDFLNAIENEQKRIDSLELMRLMAEVTGQPAKMWGGSIVGYGSYHYKYDSGHEGDSCKVGFSPRKANLTLYILKEENKKLLPQLGKHKASGSCLHINKLSDVDSAVLCKMIKSSFDFMTAQYG
jgi:hypothetical protein